MERCGAVCRSATLGSRWRVEKASAGVRRIIFLLSGVLALRFCSTIGALPELGPLATLAGAVGFAVAGVLLSRLRGRPRAFELLEVGLFALASGLVAASSFDREDEGYRFRMQVARFFVSMQVPLVVEMRLSYYAPYALWSCAVHCISSILSEQRHGGSFPTVEFVAGYLIGTLLYLVACWSRGMLLRQFQAAEAWILQEKQASEALLEMLCDAWLVLSEDGEEVLRADWHFDALIGRAAAGEKVTSFLARGEDRKAFKEALGRIGVEEVARQVAVLPLTFETVSKSLVRATVYIVGHQVPTSGSSDRRPGRYVLGLCQSQEEERQDSSRLELMLTSDPATCAAAPEPTVHSVDVFGASFEKGVNIRAALQTIADIGKKEHWALDPQDVKLRTGNVMGSGGFGSVVGGRFFGAPVVVKIAKEPLKSQTPESLASLCNELRVLRYTRHPNLVRLQGAVIDVESGRMGIVLECVPGGDLNGWLGAGDTRTLASRYRVILGICRGLWYLHTCKPVIVHGDLKGSNVLVATVVRDETAKLVDFGLSRVLSGSDRPLGGTLRWMAPELLREATPPKASSDVYSFGHLMGLVVTGLQPFHHADRRQITKALRKQRVTLPRWDVGGALAKRLRPFAERCVTVQPEARPRMAEIHEGLRSVDHRKFDDSTHSALAMAMEPSGLLPWGDAFARAPPAAGRQTPQVPETPEQQPDPPTPPADPSSAGGGLASDCAPIEVSGTVSPCHSGSRSEPRSSSLARLLAEDLRQIVSQWAGAVPRSKHQCCALHAAAHEARRVCTELLAGECSAVPPSQSGASDSRTPSTQGLTSSGQVQWTSAISSEASEVSSDVSGPIIASL